MARHGMVGLISGPLGENNMATALTAINSVSNDAERMIEITRPYDVEIKIEGVCPILFHRWSVEGVAEKAKASKGSKSKKEDDLESYVWRNDTGQISIPGEYLRMAMIGAAKYKQDPRSPRKSAMDLTKAGIIVLDQLCSTGKSTWDYIDRQRVTVQRNGITRHRPALLAGWQITATLGIVLPEYLSPQFVNELAQAAGKLQGLADHRPSFGRFQVIGFRVIELEI
jgi:hypothetical protein